MVTHRMIANQRTVESAAISWTRGRGKSAGRVASSARSPQVAVTVPSRPPAPARIRLSTVSWCARCHRRAPNASRTLISRSRPSARMSNRFATLAQAISRTSKTVANKTCNRGRIRPTVCSCRGVTVALCPAFMAGFSAAVTAAMLIISARALSNPTPGRKRATTWKSRPLYSARSEVNTSTRRSGKAKSGGSTPMISWCAPPMETRRPMTLASPPKRRCQKP